MDEDNYYFKEEDPLYCEHLNNHAIISNMLDYEFLINLPEDYENGKYPESSDEKMVGPSQIELILENGSKIKDNTIVNNNYLQSSTCTLRLYPNFSKIKGIKKISWQSEEDGVICEIIDSKNKEELIKVENGLEINLKTGLKKLDMKFTLARGTSIKKISIEYLLKSGSRNFKISNLNIKDFENRLDNLKKQITDNIREKNDIADIDKIKEEINSLRNDVKENRDIPNILGEDMLKELEDMKEAFRKVENDLYTNIIDLPGDLKDQKFPQDNTRIENDSYQLELIKTEGAIIKNNAIFNNNWKDNSNFILKFCNKKLKIRKISWQGDDEYITCQITDSDTKGDYILVKNGELIKKQPNKDETEIKFILTHGVYLKRIIIEYETSFDEFKKGIKEAITQYEERIKEKITELETKYDKIFKNPPTTNLSQEEKEQNRGFIDLKDYEEFKKKILEKLKVLEELKDLKEKIRETNDYKLKINELDEKINSFNFTTLTKEELKKKEADTLKELVNLKEEVNTRLKKDEEELNKVKDNLADLNTEKIRKLLQDEIDEKLGKYKPPKEKIELDDYKAVLLDMIYPVGSIYLNLNNKSPADLFGGVWEQIKDKFLLGSGQKGLNSVGGSEKHQLTVDELANHTHNVKIKFDNKTYDKLATGYADLTSSDPHIIRRNSKTHGGNIPERFLSIYEEKIGANKAHNNMPPYLVVNLWKRIK